MRRDKYVASTPITVASTDPNLWEAKGIALDGSVLLEPRRRRTSMTAARQHTWLVKYAFLAGCLIFSAVDTTDIGSSIQKTSSAAGGGGGAEASMVKSDATTWRREDIYATRRPVRVGDVLFSDMHEPALYASTHRFLETSKTTLVHHGSERTNTSQGTNLVEVDSSSAAIPPFTVPEVEFTELVGSTLWFRGHIGVEMRPDEAVNSVLTVSVTVVDMEDGSVQSFLGSMADVFPAYATVGSAVQLRRCQPLGALNTTGSTSFRHLVALVFEVPRRNWAKIGTKAEWSTAYYLAVVELDADGPGGQSVLVPYGNTDAHLVPLSTLPGSSISTTILYTVLSAPAAAPAGGDSVQLQGSPKVTSFVLLATTGDSDAKYGKQQLLVLDLQDLESSATWRPEWHKTIVRTVHQLPQTLDGVLFSHGDILLVYFAHDQLLVTLRVDRSVQSYPRLRRWGVFSLVADRLVAQAIPSPFLFNSGGTTGDSESSVVKPVEPASPTMVCTVPQPMIPTVATAATTSATSSWSQTFSATMTITASRSSSATLSDTATATSSFTTQHPASDQNITRFGLPKFPYRCSVVFTVKTSNSNVVVWSLAINERLLEDASYPIEDYLDVPPRFILSTNLLFKEAPSNMHVVGATMRYVASPDGALINETKTRRVLYVLFCDGAHFGQTFIIRVSHVNKREEYSARSAFDVSDPMPLSHANVVGEHDAARLRVILRLTARPTRKDEEDDVSLNLLTTSRQYVPFVTSIFNSFSSQLFKTALHYNRVVWHGGLRAIGVVRSAIQPPPSSRLHHGARVLTVGFMRIPATGADTTRFDGAVLSASLNQVSDPRVDAALTVGDLAVVPFVASLVNVTVKGVEPLGSQFNCSAIRNASVANLSQFQSTNSTTTIENACEQLKGHWSTTRHQAQYNLLLTPHLQPLVKVVSQLHALRIPDCSRDRSLLEKIIGWSTGEAWSNTMCVFVSAGLEDDGM